MELIVLGSGTVFPSAERASPGDLLELAGGSLLLDSRSRTLRQVVRFTLCQKQFGGAVLLAQELMRLQVGSEVGR